MDKDFLESAALAVESQLLQDPSLGIPVDPAVADYMGAFVEAALSPEDVEDGEGESDV
ncbi:MAG: hypothetical protein HQK81_13720 [Desulfovibrionaceae bacterium]|nr:hypothetical protein [Desulfovibrionaceae bacterium]MBF0515102.1 hypothetical protein [Desulfovibrionaceae bacterium]